MKQREVLTEAEWEPLGPEGYLRIRPGGSLPFDWQIEERDSDGWQLVCYADDLDLRVLRAAIDAVLGEGK